MNRVRVAVADDQPIFLQGICTVFESVDDVEVVGTADSDTKVLPLIANLQPDFVLMDFMVPRLSGLACLERITARYPQVKVAMISALREPGVIETALRRGASAFVLKTINPDDLAGVVRQVMNGTVFQALGFDESESAEPARPAGLTERELSILETLARGLSNDAIAKELWITRETVKFHVRNIYRKLDVSNRTEAARYAYQHGLVPSQLNGHALATQ